MHHPLVPKLNQLHDLLKLNQENPSIELIESNLLSPLRLYLNHLGKKIRSEWVELSFLVSGGNLDPLYQERLERCVLLIEALHAGSLIIDDIEDQSSVRRGSQPFYHQVGLAQAINSGNWLYFWATSQIRYLELSETHEIRLFRLINDIILKAHLGQGLDVSVDLMDLPQAEIEPTYELSTSLKTGALMSLAYVLGASVAGLQTLSEKKIRALEIFGIGLQKLDDIGNFLAPPPKGLEDLRLRRPSFIWVLVSKESHLDWVSFRKACESLPDLSLMTQWKKQVFIKEALLSKAKDIQNQLKDVLLRDFFESSSPLHHQLTDRLEFIFKKLESLYE